MYGPKPKKKPKESFNFRFSDSTIKKLDEIVEAFASDRTKALERLIETQWQNLEPSKPELTIEWNQSEDE